MSPDAYDFDADSWIPLVRPVKPVSKTADSSLADIKPNSTGDAKKAAAKSVKADRNGSGEGNGHGQGNGDDELGKETVKR